MHFHPNQIVKKVFINSCVSCVKSKRPRFYVPSADIHIFLYNLRRHALIIRASLFCSASGNNHAAYARSSRGNVLIILDVAECMRVLPLSLSIISLPFSSPSPPLSFSRALASFPPIFFQSMRCDAMQCDRLRYHQT